MTNCQVVVRSQFTLKKNKDYGTIDPLKKSFPGCSLFTLHPRSTHPLGFLFYTYFQINSPIRNLLTKAVLKAMTLHAPSMLFQNLPENQSALALPFLDQPRPLVFTLTLGHRRLRVSFVIFFPPRTWTEKACHLHTPSSPAPNPHQPVLCR